MDEKERSKLHFQHGKEQHFVVGPCDSFFMCVSPWLGYSSHSVKHTSICVAGKVFYRYGYAS